MQQAEVVHTRGWVDPARPSMPSTHPAAAQLRASLHTFLFKSPPMLSFLNQLQLFQTPFSVSATCMLRFGLGCELFFWVTLQQ